MEHTDGFVRLKLLALIRDLDQMAPTFKRGSLGYGLIQH
jgi:hypothetical protein